MKAALPSVQAQPGTLQQPTRVGSAATSGQQPSPHSSTPGHASSSATARSPSADALHSHPGDYPCGSNTVGAAAALSSQQRRMQIHQAQTQVGTSSRLPSTQEGQPRIADSMPGCTDAMRTMYGVRALLHGARGAAHERSGAVHGVGGPMRGAEGAMLDAERAMHDHLWTQEASIVDYPAAYRPQVRLHGDPALCQANT